MVWEDIIKSEEKKQRGPFGVGKYSGGRSVPTLRELDKIVKDKLDEETYDKLKDYITELMFAHEKQIIEIERYKASKR